MLDAQTYPGLHKRYGVYAIARGLLRPTVLVDPVIYGVPGENALVFHEACHVQYRHALQRLLWLVASVITFAGALAWSSTPLTIPAFGLSVLLLFGHFACCRSTEIEADVYAFDMAGAQQFVAFVYLHPHPTTRWGRWLYGNSARERIERTRVEAEKGRVG